MEPKLIEVVYRDNGREAYLVIEDGEKGKTKVKFHHLDELNEILLKISIKKQAS